MAKWICPVCGYVHEGDTPPERCPQCKVPGEKFKKMEENAGLQFVTEHELGIAKAIPENEDGAFILDGLKKHFTGECSEVGMYLAMSRQADREGYPEIAEAFRRYAFEEADHAARIAEMLGELVWDTKTNVEKRMLAEEGACTGKMDIAKKAKALGLDAIHDSIHEMAKDEARHGAGFQGLFNRYFKK
ncbi:MAG: NADH peroxidase [Paludibacteraceae bacterium]|nr:NADH peroxidase [Paludibacteraceae bacterium]